MNIETRKKILEQSLILEDILSLCLKALFEISSEKSKSLGFRGSALSFKNKIDLLSDIGRIDEDDYPNFIMFMEVRNQFIHNIDSDTFKKVLERINKRNKLIKLDSNYKNFIEMYENEGKDIEEIYSLAFNRMFIQLKGILSNVCKKIIEDKNKLIEIEAEKIISQKYKNMNKLLAESIDDSADILNIKFQDQFNSKIDFSEIIRESIASFFTIKMNEIIFTENNKS